MRVVAIPNRHYPPPGDALALADVTIDTLAKLTVTVVGPNERRRQLGSAKEPRNRCARPNRML